MNLNVIGSIQYIMGFQHEFAAFYTRTTDIARNDFDRVNVARQKACTVYVSVHHDTPAQYPSCSSAVIYNTEQPYQSYWSPLDGTLASFIGPGILPGGSPSVSYLGNKTDQLFYNCASASACGTVDLQQNNRVAVRGSAFSVQCRCDESFYTEGLGYVEGCRQYFQKVSIGSSFHATANPTSISLTWTESEPSRHVTYVLERGDSCWGPYAWLVDVESNGSDTYAYTDNTPAYSRAYYYRLTAVTEVVTAAAAPSALPQPNSPGVPTNLAGSVNGSGSVSLTWNAAAGQVTGYRVYRGRYVSMSDCSSVPHEYLGTTSVPSFTDATAPHGVDLFYRVAAFNATAGSDVSSEAQATVTTDVESHSGDVDPARLTVLANGTGFRFSLAKVDVATIAVYDVRGRLVATVHSAPMAAGVHEIGWNRQGRSGRVASGVYFARLYTGSGRHLERKFLLVR